MFPPHTSVIDKENGMSVKSTHTVKHSSSILQIIHYHLDNLLDTPVHSKVNFFLPTQAPKSLACITIARGGGGGYRICVAAYTFSKSPHARDNCSATYLYFRLVYHDLRAVSYLIDFSFFGTLWNTGSLCLADTTASWGAM